MVTMDSHTYGAGGIIQPSMVYIGTGDHEHLVPSTANTKVTVSWSPSFDFTGLMRQMVQQGQIRLPGARDPDDGAAGVPAKV